MSDQPDEKLLSSKTFNSRALFIHAIQNWWMIFLIMLLGALIGQVVHWLNPNVYEASARLTTSIDFSKAGILSDIEMDVAMVSIGDVIKSDTVLDQLFSAILPTYPEMNGDQIRKNISLERYNMVWTIRYRDHDPLKAQMIVNTWAELAVVALTDAYSHALISEQYYRQLDSLTACLSQQSGGSTLPVQCPFDSFDILQTEIARLGNQATIEKGLSYGVNPAATVYLTGEAELLQYPVNYGQAGKVFSGALAGLVLAIGLLSVLSARSVNTSKDNRE